MTRFNKRSPWWTELPGALLTTLSSPEGLSLHPLCYSQQAASQLLLYNVLFVHNSSFLPLFIKWTSPTRWLWTGSRGGNDRCKFWAEASPVSAFPPVLFSSEPHALTNGCSFSLLHVAPNPRPKSRQTQPSPDKPSRAISGITDIWWRNKGLLL